MSTSVSLQKVTHTKNKYTHWIRRCELIKTIFGGFEMRRKSMTEKRTKIVPHRVKMLWDNTDERHRVPDVVSTGWTSLLNTELPEYTRTPAWFHGQLTGYQHLAMDSWWHIWTTTVNLQGETQMRCLHDMISIDDNTNDSSCYIFFECIK